MGHKILYSNFGFRREVYGFFISTKHNAFEFEEVADPQNRTTQVLLSFKDFHNFEHHLSNCNINLDLSSTWLALRCANVNFDSLTASNDRRIIRLLEAAVTNWQIFSTFSSSEVTNFW